LQIGQMKGNVHMAAYHQSHLLFSILSGCEIPSIAAIQAASGHDSTSSSFATVIFNLGKMRFGPMRTKACVATRYRRCRCEYGQSMWVRSGIFVLPQFHARLFMVILAWESESLAILIKLERPRPVRTCRAILLTSC
jgi:hypothetical protein